MITEFNPKEALRNGKEVILEMVPDEYQDRYLNRREKNLVDNRNNAKVPGLDKVIHPDKYYPMFFDYNDIPTIVPQGWWHYSIGIEWWQHKLGETKLEKFFLVKGSEAIQSGYAKKRYFIYKGYKVWIASKIIFPPEVRYSYSRKSFKKKLNRLAVVVGDTKLTEKAYFNTLFSILGEKFSPGFSSKSIRNQKYRENDSRNKKKRTKPIR